MIEKPTDRTTPVTMTYTNYRGQTAERAIIPLRVWWGSTTWHPKPQWLLTAIDAERGVRRDFALADFGRCATPADDLSEENENLRLRLGDWMGRADMAGRALERVLAGEPVRDADEIVSICKRHVQKENDV